MSVWSTPSGPPRRTDPELARAAPDLGPARAAYRWSSALAALAGTAAVLTYVFGGLLWGAPVMNGSSRGTALVIALVTVPAIVVSMHFAAGGSARAVIVWFGMTLHLVYNAVLLLLGEPMNRLFLLYEMTLVAALAAVAALASTVDVGALSRRFAVGTPARRFAVYMWVVVGLNTFAWLGRIVPAVAHDTVPELLDGTAVTVVPTYVQDLGFWLPLLSVAAWWLWRRRPWGYLLVGGGLAFWAVEAVTVAVDQWFGHRAAPASSVASGGAVIPFALAAVVGAAVLWRFLRYIDPR